MSPRSPSTKKGRDDPPDHRAELHVEGQVVRLEPGDSWLVNAGVRHHCRVLEPFTAIEATSPPAHIRGRDEEP
jgi:quercetin dioxygenase-like cupin family protein